LPIRHASPVPLPCIIRSPRRFPFDLLRVRIGPHVLPNNLAVAPMAGVTDRPFRQLCKRLGAGYAVSEMVASNPRLWGTDKSRRRTDHEGEVAPIAVQIAGGDPSMMVEAARYNVARGAAIIDVNMGCPAKKVCNAAAGSALLADEALVARILRAVVAAVDVPVTLKIRTGPDPARRNAVTIARIAEDAGIAALAVHGRTRADLFVGSVEYATIAAVKRAVSIPVFANGDIATPRDAARVLAATGADALMIGRAAQGRPWIFREIAHYLATGETLDPPTVAEARALIVAHLADHHAFYGEATGVRIARKHLGWYTRGLPGAERFRAAINAVETAALQVATVERYCDVLAAQGPWFAARDDATPTAGAASDAAPAGADAEALAA
jgi:tRNA-dihydrouridine synthase B